MVCRHEEPDDNGSWNAVQKRDHDLLRSGPMALQVIKRIRTLRLWKRPREFIISALHIEALDWVVAFAAGERIV